MTAQTSKVAPLDVSRQNCAIVITRRQVKDERYDQWEPLTFRGYLVVFLSAMAAEEFCMHSATQQEHMRPLVVLSDDAERAWLLRTWFRVQPHVAAQNVGPVTLGGRWYPGEISMDDVMGFSAELGKWASVPDGLEVYLRNRTESVTRPEQMVGNSGGLAP